jgi:fatty acid desaturase
MEDDLLHWREQLLRVFPAKASIYYTDLAISAGLGWGSFMASVFVPMSSLLYALCTVVSVFALWRTAYFVHEVVHQRKALPGFEWWWNVVAGVPLLIPSFMIDSHVDHHRPSTYGTLNDPEYEPLAGYTLQKIFVGVLVTIVVGPALAFRALVAAPLSWVWPSLRTLLLQRGSSLVTNEHYRNTKLADGWRVRGLELCTSVVAWAVVVLVVLGFLPVAIVVQWCVVFAAAAALNQMRTQAAHVYQQALLPMTLREQVADSGTTDGPPWLTGLLHPLGTQQHAMHHLAPSLPYHAMRQADAWLMSKLPYTSHRHRGFWSAQVHIWQRARTLRDAQRP